MNTPPENGTKKLYSKEPVQVKLAEVPEYELVFQRCLEIEALPNLNEDDVIHRAWHLREKLLHNEGHENLLTVFIPEEKRAETLAALWEKMTVDHSPRDRSRLFSDVQVKLPPYRHGDAQGVD